MISGDSSCSDSGLGQLEVRAGGGARAGLCRGTRVQDQVVTRLTIIQQYHLLSSSSRLQESDNTDCSPACSPHSSLLDAPLPHPPGSAHSSHLGHAHTSIRIQQNSAVRSAEKKKSQKRSGTLSHNGDFFSVGSVQSLEPASEQISSLDPDHPLTPLKTNVLMFSCLLFLRRHKAVIQSPDLACQHNKLTEVKSLQSC